MPVVKVTGHISTTVKRQLLCPQALMLVRFSSLTVTTLSMVLMAFSLTCVLCKYNILVNPRSVYVCVACCIKYYFIVCNA